MDADASATYRGYRKQALYVLARVLTDSAAESRIYVPEGAEDLAIYNLQQQLVESVQVKDYSGPLALSHFKPDSAEGFFARLLARRRAHHGCTTWIATFGELGPELKGAIEEDKADRKKVVKKLTAANSAIPETTAIELLASLKGKVSRPVESNLQAAILEYLAGTIAGALAERTLELLLYWTYTASEERRAITRAAFLQQLDRIGEYLAALRDSSAEWLTTIRPLTDFALGAEEIARLHDEYNRGVQARWSHIVAGADSVRRGRLEEIHAQLQKHSAVIVRGASGQGKSTLGWRYLHDYSTDGLRFEVRLVQGREHALRVAHALRAHILKLRLKALVWFDVAPSDSGWTELVRELAEAGIKVLVAVREEDYRRSDLMGGKIAFGEVSLNSINAAEAKIVFAQLAPSRSAAVLDFADAWAKFGGDGPLLEFTHLVTQGGRLAQTLDHQLQRLSDEALCGAGRIGPPHLRALLLASIVHGAGCRVDSAELCRAVALDSTLRPLTYLEEEYLIRISDKGVIAGLHALRSQAISQALLKDAPQDWPRRIVEALPLVLGEDLENFLHFVFSRRPESAGEVLCALAAMPLRTWTEAGGIARALLWLGVSRYEEENKAALAGLVEKYGIGWTMFCDSFVGGGEAALHGLRQMIAETTKAEMPFVELTPKAKVYEPLAEWLDHAALPSSAAATAGDWIALGDIGYWSGNRNLAGPIPQQLRENFPTALPVGLEVSELGQLLSGLYAFAPAPFADWHVQHAAEIAAQFLRQTGSIHLEDDGQVITVIFPIALLDGGEPDGTGERRALALLRQIHDLFPQRQRIATHSIGADLLREILPFDPTARDVDVSKFVSNRVARLNNLFGNLVTYRHSRRDTWREYAETAAALRGTVSEAFRGLYRGWAQLISQSHPDARIIGALPGKELEKIKRLVERPALPKSAVDEWGYLSESRDKPGTSKPTETALQRFAKWGKAFGDFTSAINNCVQPFLNETAIFAVAKVVDRTKPVDPDGGQLLFSNLGNAWLALPVVQREFRRHFGGLMSATHLEELERNERANFRHLWTVAYWFVREPRHTSSNPTHDGEKIIGDQQQRFLKTVEQETGATLSGIGGATIQLHQITRQGLPGLMLVCDHTTMKGAAAANAALVPALWKAAHEQPWRPLEWMPIAVAFEELIVVHTFHGRALTPVGVRHNLYTLFLRDDRTAMPHELLPLPIGHELLAQAGVNSASAPLIGAVLTWQGALAVFTISLSRLSGLLALLDKFKLSQAALDSAASHFAKETTGVLNEARRAKETLTDLLQPMAVATSAAPHARAPRWLDEVNRVTQATLLSGDDDTSVTVDLERYLAWATETTQRTERAESLVSEIVEAFG